MSTGLEPDQQGRHGDIVRYKSLHPLSRQTNAQRRAEGA